MTAAITLGAILTAAVIFALGLYLGRQLGRQQRAELAAEVAELRADRDTWKQIAAARASLLTIANKAREAVYDHAEEGL